MASRGLDLLNQLIQLTGIPATHLKRDLLGILEKKNLDAKHLTLEELRAVAATYVRQIMSGLLDKAQNRPQRPMH